MMETPEQPRPEITIHRSSSRDGGIGWTVALIRREAESEDDYTARCLAKHRELENELTMKSCCGLGDHDLDECQKRVKEGARA